MTPHKHADLIKQWADGAQIQYFSECLQRWEYVVNPPFWDTATKYRVKPEPIVKMCWAKLAESGATMGQSYTSTPYNLVLTFDPDTHELVDAEVVKP